MTFSLDQNPRENGRVPYDIASSRNGKTSSSGQIERASSLEGIAEI
jgi:hypothetical protein